MPVPPPHAIKVIADLVGKPLIGAIINESVRTAFDQARTRRPGATVPNPWAYLAGGSQPLMIPAVRPVDLSRNLGRPPTLNDFQIGDGVPFIGGAWLISHKINIDYISHAQLIQNGTWVYGTVQTSFVIYGRPHTVQELTSGTVANGEFTLAAYDHGYQCACPNHPNWSLDQWRGQIADWSTIYGDAWDGTGGSGKFVMTRMS